QAHPALVLRVSRAMHEARRFEPFQKRRQGAGIEKKTLAELLDRHLAALPKDQHREILRIGEPKFFEQRLIGLVDGVHGRIDGETELLFESWLCGGFGHGAAPCGLYAIV